MIWSTDEVQVKLEGATRIKPVFDQLQKEMAAAGYERTLEQISNKLKKLKKDYRDLSGTSSTQDTDAGSFSRQECLFIILRLRISRQSKQKGCETPETFSSITMVDGECGYENYQTKLSPRQEENRTG